MAHFHNNALIGASGQGGYQIERSLRFNNADSAYLSKGSTLSGNRRLHTLSFWVKRAGLGSRQTLFGNTNSSGFNGLYFEFDGNDALLIGDYTTGWVWQLNTTARYRDPSAWYHIVFAVDTANATASSRARLYVNGIEVTAFSTASYMSQNYDTYWNYNASAIGRLGDYNGQYFSGYLTEIHFIDGQALTPSSFGETDTITGVWKPKRYSGTYGTNGYYLKFADNSGTTSTTLGKDSSGNGNNWTPNNFSVTAGSGNDSMIDTPTPYADGGNGRGNYCTLNPLDKNSSQVPKDGNLYFDGSVATGGLDVIAGTMRVTSGKWYWESTITNVGSIAVASVGITKIQCVGRSNGGSLGNVTGECAYRPSGDKQVDGSSTAYGASFTTGDVIGVALDCDAGTVTFYKNNTSQGSISYAVGSGLSPAFGQVQGYGAIQIANFGQRAFAYTPPSGFKALNTQNLPEPSIKKPNQWMDATTYTGNGSTLAVSNSGSMQPSLLWIKGRSSATDHQLVDAVRGAKSTLASNTTAAETVYGADQVSFDSGGFTVGGLSAMNANSSTYVCWQWKESATPGFDIVAFTGNGSAPATISHSLGVAPSMMIVKNRDQTGDFVVYHSSITNSQTGGIFLNLTNAWGVNSTYFNNSVPTSSNFQVGSYFTGNNIKYVAYLWSEVAGFSKFGSYTGNGSTDGPFVFCGFRPKFILIKNSTTGGVGYSWFMYDTARNTFNVVTESLLSDSSSATYTDPVMYIDILSNGFKIRGTAIGINQSSATLIFAAFAESPFKYSLAR